MQHYGYEDDTFCSQVANSDATKVIKPNVEVPNASDDHVSCLF